MNATQKGSVFTSLSGGHNPGAMKTHKHEKRGRKSKIQEGLLRRVDADLFFVPTEALKSNNTRDFCKQRVVLANADIGAGMNFGAPLTNQDIPGQDMLSAEAFHAKALRVAVSPVSGGSNPFFMRHTLLLYDFSDFKTGEVLAMPLRPAVIFSPFLLKNNDFFSPAMLHHFCNDLGIFEGLGINDDPLFILQKKHGLKGDPVSHFGVDLFNIKDVSGRHPMLLSACFHNCAHLELTFPMKNTEIKRAILGESA